MRKRGTNFAAVPRDNLQEMKEKKVKQSRHGLKIEKDLSVVKTAGFRACKKRDKSVNRRAGLHDKSKSLRGERRVYKSKPLGIVRVRRIKQTIATLSAVFAGVAGYFGMGFLFKPDFVFVEELGNSTVCAAKSAEENAGLYSASGNEYYMPEDGSLPTDHTVIENIAYMNYVLKNQPSWSSYMESTVKTVMEQKVYTHKKYYDGKLISADMPQGASNIARQFCVTDKDVSWREKSKNYIYDDMDNIDWPSEKPTGLTIDEFRIYRGLPANEFSVYILNELTVKNFNDTSVEEKGEDENGKRLYTMKLDLRVHQSGLDSAVHYYKQQMYVTGGLYAWPSFDYTTVEYTFTEDWVVKEFTINDKYAAKMGSVSADCSSTSTTVFDYAEEKAVNSYYPDYFNQTYIKWDPTSSANEPTAASCLASAFGDVLTQGATLKLELAVDGRQIDGAVHIGIDGGSFNDLRVALDGAGVGGIKLYMADENGKKTLYFAIGGNKYKLGLDAFTAENGAAGASSATVTDAAGNGADGESGAALFDADALVEQLFGGKFTLSDKGKKATLESEIELFGLKIPVNFSFNIKKNVASLNEVTAAFRLGKNDIAARMTFGTEEDIPARLTEADKAQYTSLTEGITLGVKLGFGDISLNGNAFIGFADGGIGEVRAKFGGLVICYAPADNALYIAHGNNVKYRLDLSSLGGSVDFDGILGGLDLNSVIRDALSNFYIGGGSVSTTVKVDLQQQLQQIISLAVSLEFNNGINVNVNSELFGKPLTLSVGLAHESVPEIGDKSEYTDIMNGGISADVALTVDGLRLNGTLYLEMQNGAVASVRVALNNGAVGIYYEKDVNGGADGDVIYIDLGASKIKLPVSALTGGNGGANLGELFGKTDLKVLLTQAIEGLCGGENKFGCSFTLEIDGEKVPVSLGLDLNERLALRVEASVFGKGVTADIALGGGKAPELTDKDEYVDVINGGFAISGNVLISVNGKTAKLALNSLALRLNGGLGFELDARITAAEKYFDIYASYLDNTLTLVYGSDDDNGESNFVGVRVSTKEDLELLKAALEDVYNRLCIVIGEISPENADALSKENIKDLIDKVGAGSASADIMSEIFKILGIELGEGEQPNAEAVLQKLGIPLNSDGSVDIKGLLKAVRIQSFGNGAAITLGENISVNIGIDAGAVNGGLAVQLGNASASVELTDIKLGAFAPECPVSANELLTARDLADGLDYIAAAFELVAEREVALDADVTITENGAAAMEVGVLVEYNQGENGFPLHIDSGKVNEQTGLREGMNLWVDPTAYLHLKLDLKNKRTDGKDLYVDAYILDATPVDKSYLTSGKYTTDGMLDVYLSVSNGGGNPLTVYLPMKDILTVAAMGGALLNVSDIELEGENLQELNKAVKQIAAVIDQLLVENYLGGLSSQFHSLGESVIGQILAAQNIQAKNLSELLNLLLKSVFGADAVEGNNVPAVSGAAACGNYIKRVGFERGETERALAVVLNSAAIYGNGYGDIELRVTKNSYSYGIMPAVEDGEPITQTVNKSYITGLSLSNVYFGENNAKKLDLRASLTYEAAKPSSFAGYHSFADISALLAAFVNSATHEIAEVDGGADNNGGAAVTAADIAKKYALNSNYYIDGNVKIEVSGLGWLGLNANISINSFYVTINEDNSVEFNLSIYHDSFVGVITEKATVDITIKDDLILMRKTADGGKTYVTRVMTLTDFYADIMNQLKFIFAFSDSIMNAMTGSSGGSALVMKDYGDYLDGYLAGYAYSGNNGAAVWSVDVSRRAINSLAGMEVFSQDIGVKLNADIQSDGQYKLNSLNIGSKLFGMLKFTANLNYRNPQNSWEGGNDLSGNVVKLDSKAQYGVDGRSWTTVLGGTKADELAQSVNWSRLCRDTSGKTYIEYNGSNLHYGTLKFAYATDISNTVFEEFGERQRVLYGKNIYSNIEMPEISGVMPAVPDGDDRLVGYWDYGYITTEETDELGAVIAMQAKYGAVTVSIISSQQVDGGLNGFTDYYQSEELGYVYYKTFKYDADNTVALEPQSNLNTYIFNGYYDYYTGESVESFVADRPITLYAEWVGKTINVTYSSDIALDGAEADANGVYSLEGALQYGEGGSLHTPATTVEGVVFMGWYIEAGEGYAYIADAEALKQYCANAGIAGDSVDVRLWAVWVTETAVEVTNFTRSNSFVCWTWKVGFNYGGAEFCEGKSTEISGKLGASISAKAMIELLDGDKSKITALNNGKEVQLSGNSYSDSYTSLKTDGSGDAAFVGVRVSVVVSCGEGAITLTETGYKAK